MTNSQGQATDSIGLSWGCGSVNKDPVITSINISSNNLNAFTEYEISTAASDPDGDPLSYKWSVDGGILSDPDTNPTKWDTGFPETYHLTVEVSDGKGGKATKTRAVRVEDIANIAENPPQVDNIIITAFPIYTNTKYLVQGDVFDPDSDIESCNFSVSGGTLSDQNANHIYWTTPVDAGDYSIALLARDQQGNEDMLVVFFTVETKWEVVD